MIDTAKLIKKEGESLIRDIKVEKKPEDIKQDKRDDSFIKKHTDLLLNGFSKILNESIGRIVIPDRTEVHGAVDVEFPDVQEVKGKVSIENQIKIPEVQKIVGEVTTDVKFPDVQKIKGSVDVKFPEEQKVSGEVSLRGFKFPSVQKIIGEVLAKVEFPEVQKIEGRVDILEKGDNVRPDRFVPVRLTNGRQFYEVMSQTISSNGGVISAIERLTTKFNDSPLHKVNPSTTLSYNAGGDVIKITKVIEGISYEKTISNADEVEASTKVISAWS